MCISKYAGIFPALLTPFKQNGEIDEKALEKLIEMNLRRGVKGFYVNGSSGEAFLMTVEERMLVLQLCADIVGGRATMVAQIGDVSEDKAIRMAAFAKGSGYDAVSAVTPFYYNFTFDNIKDYYRNIANASGLPVMVYYIPSRSGVTFTVEQALELMDPDYVVGIKFSSTDLFTLERIKAAYPQKPVMFGVDEMLTAGLAAGADGAIGSTYNFMPEKAVAILNAVTTGNLGEARRLQAEMNTVISCLFKAGVLEGSKELLSLMGLDVGCCRRPFGNVSEESLAMLRAKALPLLTPVK
ncbi:MAG TPA: N-acetylneuraminate lyase [Clostridiales bacterium]|nr:N-acetylneuraminate lyase [Clostridiales bacterium]